jgi:protein arginine kinase
VLSTRARLARNVEGAPFPVRATGAQLKSVSDTVLRVAGLPQKGVGGMRPLNIEQLDQRDRAALVDSHLISVALAVAGRSADDQRDGQ